MKKNIEAVLRNLEVHERHFVIPQKTKAPYERKKPKPSQAEILLRKAIPIIEKEGGVAVDVRWEHSRYNLDDRRLMTALEVQARKLYQSGEMKFKVKIREVDTPREDTDDEEFGMSTIYLFKG